MNEGRGLRSMNIALSNLHDVLAKERESKLDATL